MSDASFWLLLLAAVVAFAMATLTTVENFYLRRRLDALQSFPLIQMATRYPLSVIAKYRDQIAASFPPQFIAQMEVKDFNRLVEDRLHTALKYGHQVFTSQGRPELLE